MDIVRINTDQSVNSQKTFTKPQVFQAAVSFAETITSSKAAVNGANRGTTGAPTVVATHYGDGKHHITELALTNFVVGPLAGAAAAKTLVPATPLYTLPAGVQLLQVSQVELGLTAAGTAVTPEIGLGSVIGDGSANATIGAAGATMEDIHEGFAVATTVSHAVVKSGPKGATAGILTGISLNKAADSKNIYLNCAGTWNANNTGNLTATGKIVIVWDAIL